MTSALGVFLEISILGVIAWMIISILKMLFRSLRKEDKQKQGTMRKTSKQFKEKPSKNELRTVPSTKGEPLNLIMMIGVLIFTAIIVHRKVGFEITGTSEDYPAFIMAAVPLGLVALLLLWNIFMYARGKKKVRRWGLKSEKNELTKKDLRKIDLQNVLNNTLL